MTFLSFFILLIKKYTIIKFFFIKNVPINYPPLSKKCAKLSKNCPFFLTGPKKSQKNPKNPEKIPIFSLFFLWSQHTFRQKWYYHLSYKNEKKCLKKKVEKKVIFIFANFFFKIHFGHFFMSNFKIKKKVLNF